MDDKGLAAAAMIDASRGALAREATSRMLEADPAVADRYGSGGFADLAADTEQRLAVLAEALACGEVALLVDHLGWLKAALAARDVDPGHLATNLAAIADVLADRLAPPARDLAVAAVRAAAGHLPRLPKALPSELAAEPPLQTEQARLLLALLELDAPGARAVADEALARGLRLPELVRDVLMPVQREVGRMWQLAELSVAEEHLASVLFDQLWSALQSAAPRRPANGRTVAVTSVGGDQHGFGVRAVADCLELEGWRVRRYGTDLPAPSLGEALLATPSDLVCLGASLALHVRELARAVQAVRAVAERLGRAIPVLVGGAPLNRVPGLWRAVGADATCPDAVAAVAEAARLVAGARG